MMKVGSFGTGNMARAILGSLASAGHKVMFGSRDRDKASAVGLEVGSGARGGTNDEVARFADVIVHTVRLVPSAILESTEPLSGKLVIDVNNRDFPRALDSEPLFPSLVAQVRMDLPSAQVVKCFNTMAMEVFDHSPEELRALGVNAFVAGGDEAARRTVSDLATEIGFIPFDCGGAESADVVEIQGDFIRTLMFHQQNFLLTSQVREIPPAAVSRTGGRRAGSY